MKKLTMAQRRMLRSIKQTEQRTLADWWYRRPPYRYDGEYGIERKLIARGLLYYGSLPLGNGAVRQGVWLTEKGRKAIGPPFIVRRLAPILQSGRSGRP